MEKWKTRKWCKKGRRRSEAESEGEVTMITCRKRRATGSEARRKRERILDTNDLTTHVSKGERERNAFL